jgi:hypothetical protein
MERVPLDLRRPEIREAYLRDHEKWFLDRHENAVEDFRAEVQKMYGPKAKQDGQLSFEAVMNDESEE